MIISAVLTAGWFGFWLFAFDPVESTHDALPKRPALIRLAGKANILRDLMDPTRFALPAQRGFSGEFPAGSVEVPLALDPPQSPTAFLPLKPPVAPSIETELLSSENPRVLSVLPKPAGQSPKSSMPPLLTETQLIFSPDLQARAGRATQLEVDPAGTSEPIHVNLRVSPEGLVQHALFDSPADPTIIIAVRNLVFEPTGTSTSGTLEIRFPQGGSNDTD